MHKNTILRAILTLVTVTMLIAPATAQDQPPRTPPAVTLTPQPAMTNVAGQSLPAPPDPGVFSLEEENERARDAIEAVLEKQLNYWGPRYRVAPLEVAVKGEWAHGVAGWQSEAQTLSGPIHILAHRLPDGAWQALMPSSEGLYLRWVDEAPESLVPALEKGHLRSQAE